jgi:hypothetical protein
VSALPFLDSGDRPLTTRALADGGTVEPDALFALAKAHDATMVDLRFTDLPGRPRRHLARPPAGREDLIETYVEFRREQSDKTKIRPRPSEFPLPSDG